MSKTYIKPLTNWNVTNENPAVYDLDSKTAIEMTAKLYRAHNENVGIINQFLNDIESTVINYQLNTTEDIEAFKVACEQKFQDFTEELNTKYNYLELMVQQMELLIKDLNEGRGD